jgi:hypothetical protein
MRDTKKIISILLLACSTFVLSACSSGGAGSQAGLNVSGNWVGTTSTALTDAASASSIRTVNLSIVQDGVGVIGVATTTINGSVLIDGVCVITFSAESINFVTSTISIGAGSSFSFTGQISNSNINGTFSSIDDDPTDTDGCGTFSTRVNFVRA